MENGQCMRWRYHQDFVWWLYLDTRLERDITLDALDSRLKADVKKILRNVHGSNKAPEAASSHPLTEES